MNFEVKPESSLIKKQVCRSPDSTSMTSTSLPQCIIQHFGQFELRMGKTLPETIVFRSANYPSLTLLTNLFLLLQSILGFENHFNFEFSLPVQFPGPRWYMLCQCQMFLSNQDLLHSNQMMLEEHRNLNFYSEIKYNYYNKVSTLIYYFLQLYETEIFSSLPKIYKRT